MSMQELVGTLRTPEFHIGNLSQTAKAPNSGVPRHGADIAALAVCFFVLGCPQISRKTLNTYAIDPKYRPAYVQQWNLDLQTQIARIYVLSVIYSGSKGTGLDILRAPTVPAMPAALSTRPAVPVRSCRPACPSFLPWIQCEWQLHTVEENRRCIRNWRR
jgi:hypothetical protein